MDNLQPMKDFYFSRFYGFWLILMISLVGRLSAQSTDTTSEDNGYETLVKGSRIVFVGNSLIEDAQQYGIVEFMMLNAWPGKKLTFRNLGWSGDTAEGSARSYISTPPKPYDLLIQQIEATKPDVVVVGYGSMEAYEGKNGLEPFTKNLERLLDTIVSMGALPVLLSPIPQVEVPGQSTNIDERNSNLALYSEKIEEIARHRELPFADLFKELKQLGHNAYKESGIRLNETGYYLLASTLIKSLNWDNPDWKIQVNAKSKEVNSSNSVKISKQQFNRTGINFMVRDDAFPVPGHVMAGQKRNLGISGLKHGVYTLLIDQENIVSASAKDWAKGVEITQGHSFDRGRQIREKLIQINELYFLEYRPLNRTYLVGMRLHEQKQNAYELNVNSLFINRLEQQIAQLLEGEAQYYQLKRIN